MLASLITLLLSLTACHALYFEVLQGPEYRIVDDTYYNLTVAFRTSDEGTNDTQIDLVSPDIPLEDGLVVFPSPEEDWHLYFKNSSIYFSETELRDETEKSFLFWAYYWGYRHLSFYARPPNADERLEHNVQSKIKARKTDSQLQLKENIDTTYKPTEAKEYNTTEGVDDYYSEDEDQFLVRKSRDVSDDMYLLTNGTLIVVDRKVVSQHTDTAFIVMLTIFILINTINMGCQLNAELIVKVVKKPIGPAVGVSSQFLCMPVFSFLIGWLLLEDTLQRVGLFVLGCSPGGNASNFWTLLFNGDLNLSITMTFISTIVAMVMMPFWMMTLGSLLTGGESSFTIPYLNLIGSLVALTVPIGIGLLIKYKKPNWARMSARILKPMTFCIVIFFLTVGLWNNHKVILMMTWNMVAAGLLVSGGGYAAGALLSLLFCLKKKQIIAISIETAFQNATIAFLLIKLSLPTPDSDLAAVPAMAQVFLTGPPLILVYLSWQLIQKCGYCIPEKDEEEEENKSAGEREDQPDTPLAEIGFSSRPEENGQLDPLNLSTEPPAYPKLSTFSKDV